MFWCSLLVSYLIRGRWLLVGVSTVSVAGTVRLRFVKQRNVIRCRRFQTVSHLPPLRVKLPLSVTISRATFVDVVSGQEGADVFFYTQLMNLLSQTMGGLLDSSTKHPSLSG